MKNIDAVDRNQKEDTNYRTLVFCIEQHNRVIELVYTIEVIHFHTEILLFWGFNSYFN